MTGALAFLTLLAAASPSGWQTLHVPTTTTATAARPMEPGAAVELYTPACRDGARPKRLVIALAGWDHPGTKWRDESPIARLADRACVFVAAPSMKKTVFETRYFGADSRLRWSPTPGTRWVGELLVPRLVARLGLGGTKDELAIVGYSTGGRGALMVAAAYPRFGFVASFSGTYALDALDEKTGEYRIHAAVYGERRRHPERWRDEGSTAPRSLENLRQAELFLTHGEEDRVVPAEQLRLMARALEGHPALTVKLVRHEGHDWKHWSRALEGAFERLAR